MKYTKSRALLLLLAAAALPLAAGCTNSQGESESPVYLTAQITGTNPLTVPIQPPTNLQLSGITVQSHFKSPTASDPQHFQDVTISRYVVTYTRIDGGTKVPPPQVFGGFLLVPSGGSGQIVNPPIMYAATMQQSPLDQLLPFNGGIDQETGQAQIVMVGSIVFFGETAAGTRVESQPSITESLIFVPQ